MFRKYFMSVMPLLMTAGGVSVGLWCAERVLPACFEHGRAGNTAPRLLLPISTRELGTVPQGERVRVPFVVANAGGRRLVLLEQAGGCCGQSASGRELVVSPGESTPIVVAVDTALWCGTMEHSVQYTTNDPQTPRFTLTVRAQIKPASSLLTSQRQTPVMGK